MSESGDYKVLHQKLENVDQALLEGQSRVEVSQDELAAACFDTDEIPSMDDLASMCRAVKNALGVIAYCEGGKVAELCAGLQASVPEIISNLIAGGTDWTISKVFKCRGLLLIV